MPLGCPECYEGMLKGMDANAKHHLLHPANEPVPYQQSPTKMALGLATQVREYEEVPEVKPLRISGKVR